jgi:septal ring factor EnvC (AmiA/AmiB activator)
MEEANANNPMFSGTDFKEFLESTVDIEAITDEATRYKTAFNVLKRTGLTKERLVSTGREYINVIENDLKGFEEAFAQQYKIEVEQKEALLQQKAQELQLLNDKITTLNQEVKDISSTLTESKEKLNTNKEAFIRAGEQKKKELLAELQKIDQHFM